MTNFKYSALLVLLISPSIGLSSVACLEVYNPSIDKWKVIYKGDTSDFWQREGALVVPKRVGTGDMAWRVTNCSRPRAKNIFQE